MNQKLQVQVSTCDFPVSAANLWGDFDRILILRSRMSDKDEGVSNPSSLYFKVCKHTGGLAYISEEDFKDACVSAALNKTIPTLIEL